MESPQDTPDPSLSQTMAATLSGRVRPHQALPDQLTAIRLEVVGGPMDGIAVRGEADTLTIGRNPQCDLSLRLDAMVSMNHARVVNEGGTFWLEDLDSRNGTFLSQHRVAARTPIGPGTVFVVGRTCIEFMPE